MNFQPQAQKTAISPRSVLLVDANDTLLGVAEKIHAHKQGLLHRAFSIFIFNNDGDVLMQQRGFQKYHCPGIWTNTCCSHALHGEAIHITAHKRLVFEMGVETELRHVGKFKYRAQVSTTLIEHELDHVFVGHAQQSTPQPNSYEVANYRWQSPPAIRADALQHPEQYSPWLLPALQLALHAQETSNKNTFAAA